MLKLERRPKGDHVAVIIREGKREALRSLLIPFALALCIHLAGIVIFPVKPFKVDKVETIFPPVEVNIEYPDFSAIADLKSDDNKRGLLEPIPTLPTIAEWPSSPPPRFQAAAGRSDPYPFPDSLPDLPFLQPPERTPPLQIVFSGPLAEMTVENGINRLTQAPRGRLEYEVQVDNQRGEVFWYEKKSSIEAEAKDLQRGEAILQSLVFQQEERPAITKGTVEIFFDD